MRNTFRHYDEGFSTFTHDLFGGAPQAANSPAEALHALGVEELRPGQFVGLRIWHMEVNTDEEAVIGHADYPAQTVAALLP